MTDQPSGTHEHPHVQERMQELESRIDALQQTQEQKAVTEQQATQQATQAAEAATAAANDAYDAKGAIEALATRVDELAESVKANQAGPATPPAEPVPVVTEPVPETAPAPEGGQGEGDETPEAPPEKAKENRPGKHRKRSAYWG